MELKHTAISEDGYIIDQRQTDNLSFGRYPSSRNGCGWIAAYNFLKAIDRNPNPEKTLKELERTLLFGGRLGLHAVSLAAYLHRQNIPLQCAVTPFHAQQLAERCKAGIVLYRAGRTNHFAAFRRLPDGKLQFYGAVAGDGANVRSMADFQWECLKFPVSLTIVTV